MQKIYCENYITWKGLWCPCCGCRLRSGPRSSKYKLALRREEKKRRERVIKKLKVSASKHRMRNSE